MTQPFPVNFERLYLHESGLRQQAIALVSTDPRLQSHVHFVDLVMTIAARFSQIQDPDADLKVVQAIAIRSFNALAGALRLILSGYARDSVLVMRDILETAFLLDLFARDRSSIERCRSAGADERVAQFSPSAVRRLLDEGDAAGETRKALENHYSALAGSAALQSPLTILADTTLGPQIDRSSLDGALFELGRIADLIGTQLDRHFPPGEPHGSDTRLAFKKARLDRLQQFHSIAMPHTFQASQPRA